MIHNLLIVGLIWLICSAFNLIGLAIFLIRLIRKNNLDLSRLFYKYHDKYFITYSIEQEASIYILLAPLVFFIGIIIILIELTRIFVNFFNYFIKTIKFRWGIKTFFKWYVGYIEKKGMNL